jgi:hypothetical protein
MRIIGLILLSFGVAILIFIIYLFIKENNRIISPIPENQGVKVIFVTPTK